jgi:hypothetical protein
MDSLSVTDQVTDFPAEPVDVATKVGSVQNSVFGLDVIR